MAEDIIPTTIVGIKRLAKAISRRDAVPHSVALDLAARVAGFSNFKHASKALASVRSADGISDSRWSCTLISGKTQEDVDAAVLLFIQAEITKGRSVSMYADQELSDRAGSIDLPKDRFWNARNDVFSWLEPDHPIHSNPELKFWARLKDDPDAIVVQHVSDRGRFPNSGITENRKDIFGEALATGHDVVTGVVAETPADAIDEFVSGTEKPWFFFDDNVKRHRHYHNGKDHSIQFRKRILALA